MSDYSIPNGNSVHKEDISTLAAGTQLLPRGATVWNMVLSLETTGVAIISLSDSAGAYSASARKMKFVIDGPGTYPIAFPKGWCITTALYATCNLSSVDISLVYD